MEPEDSLVFSQEATYHPYPEQINPVRTHDSSSNLTWNIHYFLMLALDVNLS
jgi:hypothetical protein